MNNGFFEFAVSGFQFTVSSCTHREFDKLKTGDYSLETEFNSTRRRASSYPQSRSRAYRS